MEPENEYIYEKLQSVPVFEVKYELDDEKGRFFIAGNNKYVYSEGTAATRKKLFSFKKFFSSLLRLSCSMLLHL
jgi:hypothetical protein